MTKVIADITMSLDGYVTGAGADPQCVVRTVEVDLRTHTERRCSWRRSGS